MTRRDLRPARDGELVAMFVDFRSDAADDGVGLGKIRLGDRLANRF